MQRGLIIISILVIISFYVTGTQIDVPQDYISLQDAINNASNGDVIFVNDSLNENITIDKELTIIGNSNEIISNNSPVVLIDSKKVVFEGFNVRCEAEGCNGVEVVYDEAIAAGHDIIISGNIFKDFKDDDSAAVFINPDSGYNNYRRLSITIKDNLFENNDGYGIYINKASARITDKIRINNNNITNNERAILLKQVQHALLEENTISNNDDSGIILRESSNIDIKKNTIFDNDYLGIEFYIDPDSDFNPIQLIGIFNNTIKNHRAGGDGSAILIQGANEISILQNNLFDNDNGVIVANLFNLISDAKNILSRNIRINNNNIVGNNYSGVNTSLNYKDGIFEVVDARFDWWGTIDGPGGVGNGSGDSVSENVLFVPWGAPPIFTNLEKSPELVFSDTDVTISAKINALNEVASPFVAGNWEDNFKNFTQGIIFNGSAYSYIINSDFLESGETVFWQFFAYDGAGILGMSELDNFTVINSTKVLVNPSVPNGDNGWYITLPSFTLVAHGLADQTYYLWDINDDYTLYNGSFLFDWNKTFGGIEVLRFFSTFDGINETVQNYTVKVDITKPRIINEMPNNGSVVKTNNVRIGATLDDLYQSNSGIDLDSISLEVDNFRIFDIETVGGLLQKDVFYDTILINGNHKVKLGVSDIAGNDMGELTWFFTVNGSRSNVTMNVYSPLSGDYGNKRVLFNLSLNEGVDKLQYLDLSEDKPKEKRLCSRCSFYSKTRSLGDGEHELLIQAIKDEQIVASENVNIFIDTKEPDISKILPRDGDIVGGTLFDVFYDEEFLEKIELFWRAANFDLNILGKSDCPSGKKQSCNFDLNLSDFNNKEVEFFFTLYDKVHNVSSKINKVLIDSAMPVINIISPEEGIYSDKVLFDINISEEVDKLDFVDFTDKGSRFRKLCSKCDNYYKKKNFREGNHSLMFRAVDYAGNIVSVNVSFGVVE